MKCRYCGHEHTPVGYYCPKCGFDTRANDFLGILRELVRLQGKDILRDGSGLLNTLADIAPEFKKERNLLRCLVEVGGSQTIPAAAGTEAVRQAVIQTAERMAEDYAMDRKSAEDFCALFASVAADGFMPEPGNEPEPAPEPEPEPEPVPPVPAPRPKPKKWLFYAIAAVAVLLLLYIKLIIFLPTPALSGKCGSNTVWELRGGVLRVSGQGDVEWSVSEWKNTEELIIEDGVTGIGRVSFENLPKLRSVSIPGSVTKIGTGAFGGCTALSSVRIAEGVKEIGNSVFHNCKSLREIRLPDTVKSINANTFQGCDKLSTIVFPGGLKEIHAFAFNACSSLTDLVIPDGVTDIYDSAFRSCSNLRSVHLPGSLTFLGVAAFQDCPKLKSIEFAGTESQFKSSFGASSVIFDDLGSINMKYNAVSEVSSAKESSADLEGASAKESAADSEDTSPKEKALSSTDGTVSWTLDKGVLRFKGQGPIPAYSNGIDDTVRAQAEELVIEEGITKIPDFLFKGCTSLRRVTLPGTLTEIDMGAFESCTGLASIRLPDTLEKIGVSAFKNCTELTEIKIPGSVNEIEALAFNGCSQLSAVELCKGTEIIGISAFSDCANLTKIILPESLKKLSGTCFKNCGKLRLVYFPVGLEDLGFGTFSNCPDLKEIYYGGSKEQFDKLARNLTLFFDDPGSITAYYDVTPEEMSLVLSEGLVNMTLTDLNNPSVSPVPAVSSGVGKLKVYPWNTDGTQYYMVSADEYVKQMDPHFYSTPDDVYTSRDGSMNIRFIRAFPDVDPEQIKALNMFLREQYKGRDCDIQYSYVRGGEKPTGLVFCIVENFSFGSAPLEAFIRGNPWKNPSNTKLNLKLSSRVHGPYIYDNEEEYRKGYCLGCVYPDQGSEDTNFSYNVLMRFVDSHYHVIAPYGEHEGQDLGYDNSDNIYISALDFPDPAFRELVRQFDTDGDSGLSQAEMDTVTTLECWTPTPIHSLKGIERFTNLRTLWCIDHRELASIDLSRNTKLEKLYCYGTGLISLDVSHCPYLTTLHCQNCALKTLTLGRQNNLEYFDCGENKLTALDVTRCPNLIRLQCMDNQLETLTLGDHPKLATLACFHNRINRIDLSGCPILLELWSRGGESGSGDLYSDPNDTLSYFSLDTGTTLITYRP